MSDIKHNIAEVINMKKISFDASKIKRFATKSGFYFAVTACLAAVGIVAFGAFKNSNLMNLVPQSSQIEVTSTPQYNFYEQTQQVQQNTPSVPIESSSTSSKKETSSKTETSSKSESSKQESKKQSYAFPCSNTIVTKYSDGELIFSETMGDWRAHNGVDLLCSEREKINSIADGTVKSIEEDVLLGICVTIEHSGGVTAKYCGINGKPKVKEKERVQMGQTIGAIGQVPFEADINTHLHLEIYVDDRLVNPEDYLGKTINDLTDK